MFIKKAHPAYLIFFFAVALLLRACTFTFFIQPYDRYRQPDSNDYHVGALCIAHGYGMTYPNGSSIFWRTPGYPWYVSHFYPKKLDSNFYAYRQEQSRALWVQIVLSSFLPLLVYKLALVMTAQPIIACISAAISAVHPGFVLASTYLLTDALAQLLFVLFLIALFSYRAVWAATALAAYTYMRPMGQFIALIAGFMMGSVRKGLIFLLIFAALLFPWFWRNYQKTGHFFFCPLFGLYFNVFNAPKIVARTEGIPLKEAHSKMIRDAAIITAKRARELKASGSDKELCKELVCLETALPVIMKHPCYFVYDWLVEVCKTTFDLYASQLVAFANNTFTWDPLVEYLDEKLAQALYKQPMHWFMRSIAWLELVYMLLVWIGLIAGFCIFVLGKKTIYTTVWLKSCCMIGALLMQTGGFGYARLRLPVEPLMLILGVTFWLWVYRRKDV